MIMNGTKGTFNEEFIFLAFLAGFLYKLTKLFMKLRKLYLVWRRTMFCDFLHAHFRKQRFLRLT